MKKTLLFYSFLLICTISFAQVPEKMSYQAIIRDAGNAVVASASVGMQISILKGSASGTAVYMETHTPTTNVNGLISIEIGGGSVVSGVFADVDWSSDSYFIKTETDPTGGTTYTITGTSQLLSVPYALNAKTVNNVPEKDWILVALSSDQSSISAGAPIQFNTSEGNLLLSNYRITLNAGKTYELMAFVRENLSDWNVFGWYNYTNSQYIGVEGIAYPSNGSRNQQNCAYHIIKPNSDIEVELRFKGGSTSGLVIRSQSTFATIKEL